MSGEMVRALVAMAVVSGFGWLTIIVIPRHGRCQGCERCKR